MSAEFVKLPAEELIHLTPDVFTAPFWEAAAQHRLVVPRCTSCATFRLPPSAFCWNCQAQEVEWVERPGRGTVFSHTVVWHPLLPDLGDSVPYAPAVVELPGHRRLSPRWSDDRRGTGRCAHRHGRRARVARRPRG